MIHVMSLNEAKDDYHEIVCNMKSRILRWGPNIYSSCLHWGFALRVAQILAYALAVTLILAFLDTNMLVTPTQNLALGVLRNVTAQYACFCIAVEYRL